MLDQLLARMRATSVERLVRFGLTGVLVAAVHMTIVTVGVAVLDVPVQLTLVVAYLVAIALHFMMHRNLVFASEAGYALHLTAQGTRYLALALFSYIVTATSLAVVPDLIGVPVLALYFATICGLAVISFTVLQVLIFHAPSPQKEPQDRVAPRPPGGEPG
jgi:putative flippase GtrA